MTEETLREARREAAWRGWLRRAQEALPEAVPEDPADLDLLPLEEEDLLEVLREWGLEDEESEESEEQVEEEAEEEPQPDSDEEEVLC